MYNEINVTTLVQNYIKLLLETSQIKEVLKQNNIILFGITDFRFIYQLFLSL